MAEISINNLNKYFGETQVLENICFDLNPGERVSLIGANGAGKTTLFKIISGQLDFESGAVVINSQSRVGLLEQLPEYAADFSVRQVLMQAFSHLDNISDKMRALETIMADGTATDGDLNRYSALQSAFESQGGYSFEVSYNIMTNGLNIPSDMQDRPFMSLSGGEKTRVNLARIMLSGTDILLLDEPTNHLDMHSIEWLEDYLRSFKGTVLIISHDRYFLDRVTNRTLELEEMHVTSYPGNYSFYYDRKQELIQQLEDVKKRQDKEIARLTSAVDRLHLWAFMGADKMHKRAFSIQKRIDRIDRIKTVRQAQKMRGRFTTSTASGDDVFNFENLCCGYDAPLVSDFSALVLRGERIALIGDNGSGKTTMLNTILHTVPPLAGSIYEGANVKCGYLPQVVHFDRPDRNLLDTMLFGTSNDVQDSRDRLAAYGFRGDDVFKQVAVLSGGEKTRLKLCMFMDSGVNTLFLDEPTNHLDILSREWVEDAIDEFSETMIFVSHDRYFINRFATRIWNVENGKISDFIGTYEEYKDLLERQKNLLHSPKKSEKPLVEKPPKHNEKTAEKQVREAARRAFAIEQLLQGFDARMDSCNDDYVRLGELLQEKEGLEMELLELYEILD